MTCSATPSFRLTQLIDYANLSALLSAPIGLSEVRLYSAFVDSEISSISSNTGYFQDPQ
jgi:hypothetical protein